MVPKLRVNLARFHGVFVHKSICRARGSQDGLQRQQVKAILDGWEKNSPGRRQVMFRALMNARPSHLLDPKLFDFAGLERTSGKTVEQD